MRYLVSTTNPATGSCSAFTCIGSVELRAEWNALSSEHKGRSKVTDQKTGARVPMNGDNQGN